MIDAVENLVRANGRLLMWITVGGWATIGLGALGLSLRDRRRHGQVWLGVAAFASLFAVEMTFQRRYEIADWLRSALRKLGGEEAVRGRREIQAAVIVILLVAASGLLARFLLSRRRLATPANFAVLGIGVGLLGFILETISLHYVDSYYIIYWSIWYTGLVVALMGVAWALSSPAAPPPHGRYSVASMAIRDVSDPPSRRVARLGLIIVALATPELVDLAFRLIAGK